jgi:hypothetical protein
MLLLASTFEVTTSSRLNSGASTGAGFFSTTVGSFVGAAVTRGFAGPLGKGARWGGKGCASTEISGGPSISVLAVADGTSG